MISMTKMYMLSQAAVYNTGPDPNSVFRSVCTIFRNEIQFNFWLAAAQQRIKVLLQSVHAPHLDFIFTFPSLISTYLGTGSCNKW